MPHSLNLEKDTPLRRYERERPGAAEREGASAGEREALAEEKCDQVVIEIETDCEDNNVAVAVVVEPEPVKSAFVAKSGYAGLAGYAGPEEAPPPLSEFDVQRFREYLKAARQLQWNSIHPADSQKFQCYDELLAEFVSEQQYYQDCDFYQDIQDNEDNEEDFEIQTDSDSDACQCHECLASQFSSHQQPATADQQPTQTQTTTTEGLDFAAPPPLPPPPSNPLLADPANVPKMREVNGQLRGLLKKPTGRRPPARIASSSMRRATSSLRRTTLS